MKRFVFIFILVVSCLGSSAFAGIQAGPSASTANTQAAVENNGSRGEKQNMTDNAPTKKTKKQAKRNANRTDAKPLASRPLTSEEQEWEKAVYNP